MFLIFVAFPSLPILNPRGRKLPHGPEQVIFFRRGRHFDPDFFDSLSKMTKYRGGLGETAFLSWKGPGDYALEKM